MPAAKDVSRLEKIRSAGMPKRSMSKHFFARAHRGEHHGACLLRYLHRSLPRTTRGRVHQNGLACLEVCDVVKGVPSCNKIYRDGGRGGHVEIAGGGGGILATARQSQRTELR